MTGKVTDIKNDIMDGIYVILEGDVRLVVLAPDDAHGAPDAVGVLRDEPEPLPGQEPAQADGVDARVLEAEDKAVVRAGAELGGSFGQLAEASLCVFELGVAVPVVGEKRGGIQHQLADVDADEKVFSHIFNWR